MTSPETTPTKRRRRKADRPGEIIEAGLIEFADKGFAATRLDDVARRAGVAKGTLYLYFSDKEALFLAAVQSRVSPLFGELDHAVDHFPGHTRDLLSLLLGTIYTRLVETDLRILLRIMVAEGGKFPTLPALYHREAISKGRAVLRRIIERGLERGEIRASAVTDLPEVLIAPALMATLWKLLFEAVEPIETSRFAAAHREMIFAALGLRDFD